MTVSLVRTFPPRSALRRVAPHLLWGGSLLALACSEGQGPGGPGDGASGGASSGGSPGAGGAVGVGGSGASGGSAGTGGTAMGGGGGTLGYVEPPDPAGTWRSVLFPRGWVPLDEGSEPDAEGRHLPDFSYAGYHRGEQRPPYGQGSVVETVDATLGDGVANATAGIQAAIDAACAKGGGVVRLPAGTYRIRLPGDASNVALRLGCSHVVLRGDGPTESRIVVDDPLRLRSKTGIALGAPSGGIWDGDSTTTHALAEDTLAGSRTVRVDDATGLAVGDHVAVRNEVTPEFRAEHRMDAAQNGDNADWWGGSFRGLVYPRQIVAIRGDELELDAPIHYPLLTRDAARLYELPTYIEESGIESVGLGMVQNTTGPTGGSEGSHDSEYETVGTTGYQVHASRLLEVTNARDVWLYDVDTFVPTANGASGVHVLSNGFSFSQSAYRVTIEGCSAGRPQYRGGGGNGYLFHVQGNDLLFVDDLSTNARHGFIINQASAGVVFLRSRIVSSRLTDDSHRFLANANLYDGIVLDRGWLSAVNRGNTSSGAGFTATSHVFWNTEVVENHASADDCAVETAQYGWGYVVGTRAPEGQSALICTETVTNGYWATLDQGAPEDFAEGEGLGATLWPPSLYDAQRARRCGERALDCDEAP